MFHNSTIRLSLESFISISFVPRFFISHFQIVSVTNFCDSLSLFISQFIISYELNVRVHSDGSSNVSQFNSTLNYKLLVQ